MDVRSRDRIWSEHAPAVHVRKSLKVPILRALGCVQQSGAGFAVAIQGSVPACADRPQMGVAKTGEIFQPIAKAPVEGGMSHKYKGHLP